VLGAHGGKGFDPVKFEILLKLQWFFDLIAHSGASAGGFSAGGGLCPNDRCAGR
jgi:hypothetical protein